MMISEHCKTIKIQIVMRLSIVSPAPHYSGNSRDLAGTYPGIYRILCPRRRGTYPRLMREDVSVKRAGNLLPRDVCICRDSDQRHPGYGAGPYPGIYKKNVSPTVLHSTRGCSLDITKYKIESPGKSPLSPGSGGRGYN